MKQEIRFYFRMVKKIPLYFRHVFKQTFFWIKKGKFKNAQNYLWDFLFSEEEGAGLFQPIYRKIPWLTPYPWRLELEATNNCYFKCLKCEHTYWKVKPKDLSFRELKHILKNFPKLRDISLSGIGHGFYNKKFAKEYFRMLRYLKSKQIFIQFFDPFFDIDEKIAREIIKIGVDRIWMSIDGVTKETYNKLQKGLDFDRVIKNIKRMIQLKKEMKSLVPEICFHFIVQKGNEHEMPGIVDLVLEITKDDPTLLKHLRCTRLLPFKKNEFLKPEVKQKYIDEAIKRAKNSGTLFRIGPPIFEKCPIETCACWATPFITVEGTIYPCCAFTEMNKRYEIQKLLEPRFGNIFKKSFKKSWNSNYFKKFRKDIVSGKVPYVCTKPIPCRVFEKKK